MMVVLCLAIQLYGLVVLARILLSWIPVPSEGALASVYSAVFAVTEPPLAAIRSVIPPVRLGALGLDLSPILLMLGLLLLSGFICR